MGSHSRGGLEAQNWRAAVCFDLGGTLFRSVGELGFLDPFGVTPVMWKHSNLCMGFSLEFV